MTNVGYGRSKFERYTSHFFRLEFQQINVAVRLFDDRQLRTFRLRDNKNT